MSRAAGITRRLALTGKTTRRARTTLAVLATLAAGCGLTFAADDVTEGQVLKALAPKPLTRGLSVAAGSDGYDQDLSERRAEAIKRTLLERFGLAAGDLVTLGYGESKLKDPAHPMDEVNRSVQVVNMANRATAAQ